MTTKQQLLTVDLKELKPRVLKVAETAGKRPSAWARDVIAQAVQADPPSPAAAPAPNFANGESAKFTLQFEKSEHARLGELARAEGLTRAQWLRHRVRQPNAPVIPTEHVDALVQSNYQLAGLGRNLNQIARSLNAYPGRTTAAERAAIDQAVTAIRDHLAMAACVMAALPQTGRTRKAKA